MENRLRNGVQQLFEQEGKEIFFEPDNPKKLQMRRAYRNFDNDEFAEFIVENSSFSSFKRIGYSEEGRPLYKIY